MLCVSLCYVFSFKRSRVAKTFLWLRNLSDFLVGSLRHARHFDREVFVRQLVQQGFTHVTVNGLGVEKPFESGPPGDVYSWFYDYSPDLDQFVTSRLIAGFYPKEYLRANLEFLKVNAGLARKNGLIPGLHINSPRSMPEAFWQRYPFLRGARVDHPRESFLPRYTLAMAHPVVQEHYRELLRNILKEVPDLGFIHVWTNDSGAGFEFVNSLYAGRNGGPYLLREWKNDQEIARAAGKNVLTYYHLLRDEARKVNPEFRLVCDLGPFDAERPYIIEGLGDGIDAGRFAYFEFADKENEQQQLNHVGALQHATLELANNNIIGAPFPRLVYERLHDSFSREFSHILAHVAPHSLAPYDINGEVLSAVQQNSSQSIDDILQEKARAWVGDEYASKLIGLWNLSDTAVRDFPQGIPYSTFGFPWFRLWVRPFVPNIDAIPEQERAYYERYLVATFNNPNRVDLNNNMMWNFLTVAEAEEKKEAIDAATLKPLSDAIHKAEGVLRLLNAGASAQGVFQDQYDRLVALRCFYGTLHNIVAWIEGVHGFLQAASAQQKEEYRVKVREVVTGELKNAQALLTLWRASSTDFMPISARGETAHCYGGNFGDLLEKKIKLMERHKNDEPSIDPKYMWRMPN